MVRVKQPIGSKTVKLLIRGPKSIVKQRGGKIIETGINRTWYSLIWEDLGIEISPASGFFVCSRRYTPTNPKHGRGWRSELSDSIANFVAKYERQRKVIIVRICDPQIISRISQALLTKSKSAVRRPAKSETKQNQIFSVGGNRMSTGKAPSTPFGPRGKTTGVAGSFKDYSAKQRGMATALHRASFKTSQIDKVQSKPVQLGPEFDQFWNADDDNQDIGQQQRESKYNISTNDDFNNSDQGDDDNDLDDDTSSLCTAVSEECNLLRKDGIQVEYIKDDVMREVPRFTNAFLLRVQNEIRKLKQNKRWDKNFEISPLGCYFLQKLFFN